MHMAEIGAQFRQVLLDVNPVTIPPDERCNGKCVPKVMQPGTAALLRAPQPYLA